MSSDQVCPECGTALRVFGMFNHGGVMGDDKPQNYTVTCYRCGKSFLAEGAPEKFRAQQGEPCPPSA